MPKQIRDEWLRVPMDYAHKGSEEILDYDLISDSEPRRYITRRPENEEEYTMTGTGVEESGLFHGTKGQKEADRMAKTTGNMDDAAIDIVCDYIHEHLDKSDPTPEFQVYTVWKAKVLQNWKYLLSSTLPDGMYYELTYNGDKKEWYLDAYKKFENRVISE